MILDNTTGVTATLGTTTGTSTYGSCVTLSDISHDSVWSNNPKSLVFDIDGETVEFTSQELIRLKEMLNSYIRETNPEDLL